LIKEFQHILSLLTADFINIDEMVIPQTFLDSRKKVKPVGVTGQSVGRKMKLAGEIVGKQAVELQRYVDGKNCKWESTTYKLETLHQAKYLTVYGSQENIQDMDELYSVIPRRYVRFVSFSDRELENVKKIDVHNWMSYDEFMKGENKLFKRCATSYRIKQFKSSYSSLFDRRYYLEDLSTSLLKNLDDLHSYVLEHYVNNGSQGILSRIAILAEEKNLFDPEIYQTLLDAQSKLDKLPFLNYMFNRMSYGNNTDGINCVRDLCKYHKFRLDIKNYKNNIVEQN
jgi:hypothetical protein